MIEQKSLKKNFIFNFIRQICLIGFPIITFSYSSRLLGTEGIGIVNYAKSITTYFILLSGLGITNYAIREGAGLRDNKDQLSDFSTEIFSINVISTIVSLVLYFLLISINYFQSYRSFLLIFSLLIPFTTIGVEWIFGIYEEYQYISIRTLVFQLISLILLFALVRDRDNLIEYSIVLIVSNVGSNLLNFFKAKKYVKIGLTFRIKRIKKHLKAIFTMFGLTIASQVYMNMDVTMVGLIVGDSAVGLYTAANKLVQVIISLIGSLRVILIPRLSYQVNKGDIKSFDILNGLTADIMLLLGFPIAAGLFSLSPILIVIFCGKEFLPAALTLKIFSIDIVFAIFNGFFVYQLFIPLKKEKLALYGTILGAVVNLISNSILIPIYSENGAAIGTCCSEFAVFVFSVFVSRKFFKLNKHLLCSIQCLGSSLLIFLICYILKCYISDNILYFIISIVLSIILYFGCLLLLKNKTCWVVIKRLINKITNN